MNSFWARAAVALLAVNTNPSLLVSANSLRSSNNQYPSPADLPEFLQAQTDRLLQVDDEEGQDLGQRCGRNTACQNGLECEDTALAKRCFPAKSCLEERLEEFEVHYGDLEDYKARVLNSAGTSVDELVTQIQESNRQQSYASSQTTLHSVIESIHLEMEEPIQQLRTIMRECGVTTTGNDDSTSASNSNSTNAKANTTDVAPVEYVGYHIEAGVIFEASLSYIQAKTDSGFLQEYLRYCLGVQTGGGAEFSLLWGQIPEGTDVKDAGDFSFYTGLDIGLGLHFGGGGGFTLNPDGDLRGYFELAFGVGLGAGVGGSLCWSTEVDGFLPPPFPLP